MPAQVPVTISWIEGQFDQTAEAAVTNALSALFSDKHLYQSVRVSTSELEAVAKKLCDDDGIRAASPSIGSSSRHVPDEANYVYTAIETLRRPWGVEVSGSVAPRARSLEKARLELKPPATLMAHCAKCGRQPFNPTHTHVESGEEGNQWFLFSYQCQSCKDEPTRFLVRRADLKLTLAGRDPIETIEIPKVLPKEVAKHFRNAVLARNSGQMLPALFMLRTFIDQYWRLWPDVKARVSKSPRPTGEELAEIYQAPLPADFKTRFPSLGDIYGRLSAAIHEADENEPLFEQSAAGIVKHFQARALFELPDPPAAPMR